MVIKIEKHCNSQIIEWFWASNNELIPTPFYTSCYLIDGLLIDSGAPASENDLLDFIKTLDEADKPKRCVITHHHEDHSGGAHMLKETLKIPIYASKKAIPLLKNPYDYPEYRKITWGERLKPVEAESVKSPFFSNSQKYKFEVFPMPGHAPDLIALIERKKEWVFVSDAVQPKYKMLFGHNSNLQEDIVEIYQSIKGLYSNTEGMTNLKIFISGKGFVEGREYIKKKVTEIENLHYNVHRIYNEEVQKGLKKENLLKKVLKRMFKRETVIGKLTKGDLSSMNLVKQLIQWPLND